MNCYKIEIISISGWPCSFVVSFNRKPLIHEAWAWIEAKLGDKACYMQPNTLSVNPITVEPFEVV